MSAAEASRPALARRRFLRWSLIGAAVAVVLAYLTAIGWLMANEVQLVFVPNRKAYPLPAEVAARVQRVPRLDSAGRQTGLLWALRQPDEPQAPWVLYLHGNGANLSTPGNVERYEQLGRLGMQVLAVEYPGFGPLPGAPSEAALDTAARDGWQWLREQGVPASAIVVYGWSLGSGVATSLASTVNERAVILEGAFTGVDDRASELYPWLPVRWMVRNRFASRNRIAHLGSPILLLHAADDTIVPIWHGRALFAAALPPRRLVELAGGHVHPNRRDATRYEQALDSFLAEVFPAGRAPVQP